MNVKSRKKVIKTLDKKMTRTSYQQRDGLVRRWIVVLLRTFNIHYCKNVVGSSLTSDLTFYEQCFADRAIIMLSPSDRALRLERFTIYKFYCFRYKFGRTWSSLPMSFRCTLIGNGIRKQIAE